MKRTPTNHVYIGVVTYNSASTIRQCVRHLLRQTYRSVSIIAYDNNSGDSTLRILDAIKGITVVRSPVNRGYGGGHNAIIEQLPMRHGDYYLSVNPDAYLSPNYVATLLRTLRSRHGDWGTGKLYTDTDKTTLYSVGHAVFPDGYVVNIGYGVNDVGQYSSVREVFGAPGAAAMYSYDCIRTVQRDGHFFDPAMFLYYEDTDVDWRARLSGLHCFCEPRAIGIHEGGRPKGLNTVRALTNRYRSAIKNSFPMDLFRSVLPVMCMHCALRLVTSPLYGAYFIALIVFMIPRAVAGRTSVMISRAEMGTWFSWSRGEETNAPTGFIGRLRMYFHTV